MEAGIIVAIIFGGVAVVGVIIALLSYLKQNPKKVLEYRISVLPIVRTASQFSDRLVVTFDGLQMQNPHLVEVSIYSVGRADIRRVDFDGNQPLEFNLGPQAGPIDDNPSSEVFKLEENRLKFMPKLISRQHGECVTSFLCSGQPNINLIVPHPLADTTVRNGSRTTAENNEKLPRIAAMITLLGLGTAIVSLIGSLFLT